MKTKFKYFSLAIAALLMVGFASCSSDDDTIKGVDEIETGGTKMQLVVNMPTGASTRSTTGTGDVGSEVGTPDENNATTVLLSVFDATTNKYVANYAQSLSDPVTADGKVTYKTGVFEANALRVGGTYKVYVYVNPYPSLDFKAQNPDEFFVPYDTAPTELERYESVMTGITTKQGFFMSNATTVTAQEVLTSATDKANPYTINANVERAVARFDYTPKKTDNKYLVGDAGDVSVQFTDYKLVNTSKQFYHLKRVNTTGDLTAGIQGVGETDNNYVMDTDWEAKMKTAADWVANDWAKNFYFYLKSENIASFTKLGTTVDTSEKLSYVIENTLPKINQSKKGLATAIVFKGKLVFDGTTYPATGAGVDVYVWNNKFYGAYGGLPVGVKSLVGTVNKENLEKAGVTAYKWDGTGYPVYYVYYNRHNNNNLKTTGAMEFAVVRNNVYKLSISNVNMFGHSNDPQVKVPENADPNPEKPEDDIETDNIYMNVTATVLPWTVRTNVIEF